MDDVFDGEQHSPSPSSVSMSGLNSADFQGSDRFLAAYNIIRAAKQKKLAASRLSSAMGFKPTLGTAWVGYMAGRMAVDGDLRGFLEQNYHCATKGLNISFSMRKPDRLATDELVCLACLIGHSFAAKVREAGQPIAVILSDQNISHLLLASEGDCVIVIQVEDGNLSELETVLLDRLKAYTRPHGTLPAGSIVVLGSLSHLCAKGLGDYAVSFF